MVKRLNVNNYRKISIGILALQGGYAQHLRILEMLGVESKLIRYVDDLRDIDGLILPGGETTTMSLLLQREKLWDPLNKALSHIPVLGTCAGSILLGNQLDDKRVKCFNTIDFTAERNAYGRQIESFTAELAMPQLGINTFPAVFIRAPKFTGIGSGVEVLAHYGDEPVLLRQNHVLAASFHPELTNDTSVHRYFIHTLIAESKG